MCELTHGMTGEQHGHGMGAAWARHAMCESAFNLQQPSIPCQYSYNIRAISLKPYFDKESGVNPMGSKFSSVVSGW
jgi:hypothetical protein